jgi:hypothetical protein
MAVTVRIQGARAAGRRVQQTLTSYVTKQVTYAGRQALNEAAFDAQQHINKFWIPNVFDRPTFVTRGATKYRKASEAKPVASVYIDDYSAPDVMEGLPLAPGAIKRAQTRTTGKSKIPPVKWFWSEVYGGPRRAKAFERLFREIGILPAGMFVTPASGTTLDASGNIPGSFINFIYNFFKTSKRYSGENEPVSREKKERLRGVRLKGQRVGKVDIRKGLVRGQPFTISPTGRPRYSANTLVGARLPKSGQLVGQLVVGGRGRAKHLKPGVYVATGPGGSNLKAILKFVRQPVYRRRLPFHTAVAARVEEKFAGIFYRQYERALANAKAPAP